MADSKVTVKVDPELRRQAKIEAARRGVALSDVVRDALRAFVGQRLKGGDKPKTK